MHRINQRLPFRPSRVFAPVAIALLFLFSAGLSWGQACPDVDADGYADCTVAGCNPAGLLCGDCNDSVVQINPAAIESCNQLDDNCDGQTDEGFSRPLAALNVADSAGLPSDTAGRAVISLGDVDGDGLGDFALGVPQSDLNGTNNGAVVVFSGADRSVICRATDPTPTSGSIALGSALAAIDDIDGDGAIDFAAAAKGDDTVISGGGAVLLFSGDDCSLIRRLTDPMGAANDGIGDSIARIDDLSGDGIDDVIVGVESGVTAAGSDAGLVLVFNAATGSTILRMTDPAGQQSDHLGVSVAGLGDVNGDMVPDIAAGADDDNTPIGSDSGSITIFSGSDGSIIRLITDAAGSASDFLGQSIAVIADLNADGITDILAGSPGDDDVANSAGAILAISGADGSLIRKITDAMGAAGDDLGTVVTSTGDLDGDGIADILAGVPERATAQGNSAGEAILFSGIDGSVIRRFSDATGASNDDLGSSVTTVLDTSGDGYPEFLVGVPNAESSEETSVGKAILFSIESDCDGDGQSPFAGDCDDTESGNFSGNIESCDGLDNDCDSLIDEDEDGDGFDLCSDCAPGNPFIYPGAPEVCNGLDDNCDTFIDEGNDIDGDGFESPCDCDDGNSSIRPGQVESCDRIDQNCDGQVDETFSRPIHASHIFDPLGAPADIGGSSVVGLGDVNGDGFDDFAMGVPQSELNNPNNGGVLIFSGLDRSVICRALDPAPTSNSQLLGSTLARTDDIDGDGVSDLAATAGGDDTVVSGGGAVLLFSGDDCSFIRRLTDPMGSSNDGLGDAIDTVSDLTNDGIDDLIVGVEFGATAAGSDAGFVLVFDPTNGNVIHRLLDPMGRQSDHLGVSVADMGDLNGDTIPDIAAGSDDDNTLEGADSGSVLIFSGADGSLMRKVTDPMGSPSDFFGQSISAIQDLNSDGITDLVVGIPGDTSTASNDGAIALVSGADGSIIRRLSDPSAATADSLGTTVLATTDLNGDGVADVFAGVPGRATAQGSNAGEAILFSGADGTIIWRFSDPNGATNDNLGQSITILDDASGDGYPDFLVGVPNAESSEESNVGKAILLSLESDCDNDGESPIAGDCDDADGANFSGNIELCDGQDNDCDTLTDEDEDGDGFDLCSDCAPANPFIFPGADERCNGLDDDCDTFIDEGSDIDGDGFETPCDCDDGNSNINPGAAELCDRIDQNCDGQVDETFSRVSAGQKFVDPLGLSNDLAGDSVASLGDVNGDGRDDIAIGITRSDLNGVDNGGVTVFSGLDRSVICRAADPAPTSNSVALGGTVGAIDDIDGDGIPDFAATAKGDDTVVGGAGAVLLFSGDDCSFIRRLTDPLGSANDAMGDALASMSDLTNDGIGELIVGIEFGRTDAGSDAGFVLIFDPTNGDVIHRLIDPIGRQSDHLGASVAALGDVNGDTIPDIAAGADDDNTLNGSDSGSVLIFSGLDGSLLRKITDPGGSSSDFFGRSISAIADVDGDGLPDLVVGSPGDDDTASGAGSVVILSAVDGSLIRRLTDPLAAVNDQLGGALTSTVDMNGDGTADVLAGISARNTAQGADAGEAILFSGVDGSVLRRFSDLTGAASDNLGSAVAVADDISGDGYPDLLVGSPSAQSDEENDVGKVILFSLESDCDNDGESPFAGDCDDSDGLNFSGNTEVCDGQDNDCDSLSDEDDDGDGFGICSDCDPANPQIYPGAAERCNGVDDNCDTFIDEGVDVDGDGFQTPCDCNDAAMDINPGALELCDHIDQNCDGLADEIFSLPTLLYFVGENVPVGNDNLGQAVVALEDVNGDGTADFAIGVPSHDSGGVDNGSALIYSGVDRSVICRATDPMPTSNSISLGSALAAIDDIDGDGINDLAAAVKGDDTIASNSGAVLLFSGDDCAFIRRLVDPLGSANDGMGDALAVVSDINNDGVDDLVVGVESGALPAGTDVGFALVFDPTDGTVILRLTDPEGRQSDHLGVSMAGLGDVNGDNVPDIAVGADDDNTLIGTDSGSVLIFSGADGSVLLNVRDPAGATSDFFGRSVSAIADVNGDGITDVVAGAPGDDDGASASGSIVIFSGADGSLIRRLTDPTGATSDALGSVVIGTRDLNGDGVGEVLAGVSGRATGQGSDAGEAILFSGGDGAVLRRLSDPMGAPSDRLGTSIAVISDLGLGGEPEFLVGAPDAEFGAITDSGNVIIFGTESDCDNDGSSPFGGDCDDSQPTVNPFSPEICDDLDNNCNTLVDEGLGSAPEFCNGLDDNCNGIVDEGNPGGGASCSTGLLGVCDEGALVCDMGALSCFQTVGPGAEICGNGFDEDCDGTVDETTEDSDGDGITNCSDNCPDAFNPGQEDMDGDLDGDACDCTPNDPTNPPPPPIGDTLLVSRSGGVTDLSWSAIPGAVSYHTYRGYLSIGNAFAYNQQCLDANVSGTTTTDPLDPRRFSVFYYLVSTVCDATQSGVGLDSSGAQRPQPFTCPAATLDDDGDGTEEAVDNCPGFQNANQADFDNDEDGDVCDNCVQDFNPTQSDIDGDGLGDVCDPDRDGDGVDNVLDNCPDIFNPGQEDADMDMIGDVCDT